MGFPCGTSGKESACNEGGTRDLGSVPESGRSPGVENGNPLQYPGDLKESDMTWCVCTHTHTHTQS